MIKAKNPVILFRGSLAEENELDIAKKYFPVIEQRTHIFNQKEKYDLIVPRYSALPYFDELEKDVEYLGSKLLNSYKQHCYVANIKNWYNDLYELTPKTWFYLNEIPEVGPFVLKGITNSKKWLWSTMMFAKNKQEAVEVYIKLSRDSLIGEQEPCIRKYIPLKKLDEGLNGLPISEEYRFFVLNGKIMGKGFYWSNFWDELEPKPNVDEVPKDLIDKIIKIVSPNINAFVFDVARTADNNWILIELNDFLQSGPSMVDLEELYFNTWKELTS